MKENEEKVKFLIYSYSVVIVPLKPVTIHFASSLVISSKCINPSSEVLKAHLYATLNIVKFLNACMLLSFSITLKSSFPAG